MLPRKNFENLHAVVQGYSTIIRIGPERQLHYLQRSRNKFMADLIRAKKYTSRLTK